MDLILTRDVTVIIGLSREKECKQQPLHLVCGCQVKSNAEQYSLLKLRLLNHQEERFFLLSIPAFRYSTNTTHIHKNIPRLLLEMDVQALKLDATI